MAAMSHPAARPMRAGDTGAAAATEGPRGTRAPRQLRPAARGGHLARPWNPQQRGLGGFRACPGCLRAVQGEGVGTQGVGSSESLDPDTTLVPVYQRIFADHLNPILAYRCLTKEDEREAPSFLLESVDGERQGRYSFLGTQPRMEVFAHESNVVVLDHKKVKREVLTRDDPLSVTEELSAHWKVKLDPALPDIFTGGWVGYTGYDTVRYVYPKKIPFGAAPKDDREVAEMHLALYDKTVIFDNVQKCVYVVAWMDLTDYSSEQAAELEGKRLVSEIVEKLTAKDLPPIDPGRVGMDISKFSKQMMPSNMEKGAFMNAVAETKEHIQAGNIFQLVLSQRFERRTFADPFEVYRSLRIVNPSPYMIYLQTRDAILVASSPEILCRVDGNGTVTNRPLAGTRKRGATPEDDLALEEDLLADEKEKAEHIMLVDLGRNDVGSVAQDGTVVVERMMDIERYSHVMHISSTVTGKLREELSTWDALRSALPAGTVSGAPKVRAMQIIDDLEVNRRGPYAGGVGYIGFNQTMDMALALRTMVIPTTKKDTMYCYKRGHTRKEWVVHIQAGAGLVADSDPEAEYQETVNKSAALSRAIDLAEQAFLDDECDVL